MQHRYTIERVMELIAVRSDCEQGFRMRAGYTRNEQLKEIFMILARECVQARLELEGLVRELGADPEKGSAPVGGLRPVWGSEWTALARSEDGAILEECERGASRLLEVYRNALDDHLPDWVRGVVLRQFEGVMSHHDQIRDVNNQRPIRETPATSPRGAQAGQ